ncbi:MAG: [citrate (pro-3S)-lyase] ligase [Oscillospiraceae bacterium]|nr:[citrate (pro-3S)-lyase] ligase [Oscillospiraceae bacterium]
MDATLRDMPLRIKSFREQVRGFLARHGLRLEPVDYYAGLFCGGDMVCGGGYAGNTIKCVAVEEDHRGEGLSGKLLSHLLSRLRYEGAGNVFLFTKPENEALFRDLSFCTVGLTETALLMETDSRGISSFCEGLGPFRQEGVSAGIVMNANPFTNGHLHLVEQAKSRCDALHIFVVEEDVSDFPYAVRKRLVKEGCAHIKGVFVHGGGPYIISGATFPTYFLKEDSDFASVHAGLDVDIFGRRIAPCLNISLRFAAEEPLDPATARYNAAMSGILPRYGVAPVIIPRKEEGGRVISASAVRRALAAGDREGLRPLVPPATLEYLLSPEGENIAKSIKGKS